MEEEDRLVGEGGRKMRVDMDMVEEFVRGILMDKDNHLRLLEHRSILIRLNLNPRRTDQRFLRQRLRTLTRTQHTRDKYRWRLHRGEDMP